MSHPLSHRERVEVNNFLCNLANDAQRRADEMMAVAKRLPKKLGDLTPELARELMDSRPNLFYTTKLEDDKTNIEIILKRSLVDVS
jgi:hypothetical protein